MRPPSARVRANRCTIYPYVAVQDADAGNDADACFPSASAVAVPCSHQCERSDRVDEFGRVTTVNAWTVIFGYGDVAGLGIKINDRLDLLDLDGTVLKTVYADGSIDMASRGSAIAVPCRETL